MLRQLRKTEERREDFMKVKEILSQSRRDFTAMYECEGCGHIHKGRGYDDAFFHTKAVPQMKCPECGKTSAECGANYRPLSTKYPEGVQV
jgi:predicted RNA-binding Zn-ribbon protein involved in translation (DUF1610 family)